MAIKNTASVDVTNDNDDEDDDVDDDDDTTMNLSKAAMEFVIWAHKKALERAVLFSSLTKVRIKQKCFFFFAKNWPERLKLFVGETKSQSSRQQWEKCKLQTPVHASEIGCYDEIEDFAQFDKFVSNEFDVPCFVCWVCI